jgi:hypothetical protein
MNGRKARERRRRIETTTPRDPAAPEPPSFARAKHPLGESAGAYLQWQEHMKAGLLRIMEENRKALDACTQDEGCPSSVHYPDCLAVR